MVQATGYLVKEFITVRRYGVSLVPLREWHQGLSFRMGPRYCIDASGPDSWLRTCKCLHRNWTVSATSQHHFLPGPSSIFARSYPGSCWKQNDLTVHHVVRSAHRSIRSKGELSCPVLMNLWQIPSDTTCSTVPLSEARARTCLTYACTLILWQWVHPSWHGHHKRALAMLCFHAWWHLEARL